SRANQQKHDERCNVEKIAFVSRGSELSPSVADAEQLDRAEAIWQMNRENGYRQQDDAGNADERDEASDQDGNATQNFGGNCEPGHQLRSRNADGMKNRSERCRSAVPFRKAMCEQSITNNQSKRDRRVGRTLRPQQVHGRAPSVGAHYDAAPPAPVRVTAPSGLHTELRANTATITRPIAAPMSPSNNRSIPVVSPGAYIDATRIADT